MNCFYSEPELGILPLPTAATAATDFATLLAAGNDGNEQAVCPQPRKL